MRNNPHLARNKKFSINFFLKTRVKNKRRRAKNFFTLIQSRFHCLFQKEMVDQVIFVWVFVIFLCSYPNFSLYQLVMSAPTNPEVIDAPPIKYNWFFLKLPWLTFCSQCTLERVKGCIENKLVNLFNLIFARSCVGTH